MPAPTNNMGSDWAAAVQAASSVVALVIAGGLGWLQLFTAARERRRRVELYLVGTSAALDQAHAALTVLKAQMANGGQTGFALQLMGSVPTLGAAVEGLRSLPLHQAPSKGVATCILNALEQVRVARDGLEGFVRSGHPGSFTEDYSPRIERVEQIARELGSERRRLLGKN